MRGACRPFTVLASGWGASPASWYILKPARYRSAIALRLAASVTTITRHPC